MKSDKNLKNEKKKNAIIELSKQITELDTTILVFLQWCIASELMARLNKVGTPKKIKGSILAKFM